MQATGQPSIQERYAMVAALPRPRPLRRTPIGDFTVVIATVLVGCIELALLVYLYFAWQATPSLGGLFVAHKAPFIGAILVPFFIPFVRAGQRQQKNLVANGEVAVGSITRRYGTMNKEWRLAYEFTDKSGNRIAADALDSTTKKSLKEGDQMLVYYDPKNPRNALAQATASYEPAVAALEPDPHFS